MTEEEVMESMKTAGDGEILAIYASENAMDPRGGINTSLPGPLQVCAFGCIITSQYLHALMQICV